MRQMSPFSVTDVFRRESQNLYTMWLTLFSLRLVNSTLATSINSFPIIKKYTSVDKDGIHTFGELTFFGLLRSVVGGKTNLQKWSKGWRIGKASRGLHLLCIYPALIWIILV